MSRESESRDYIRSYYNLPFLKRGIRVFVCGRPGEITGFSGSYLIVKFDDGPIGGNRVHPTWGVEYLDGSAPF